EFIDRIPFFVNALDDAVRSLVELGAEETRDGRIALIRGGQRERSKAFLAVRNKARIYEIKLNQLLTPAEPNAGSGLPQIAEKIQMADINESVRPVIGRKTTAVCKNSRSLFFDIDDNIARRCSIRQSHRRLRFDFDASKNVGAVKVLFACVNVRRTKDLARPQSDGFFDRLRFRIFVP